VFQAAVCVSSALQGSGFGPEGYTLITNKFKTIPLVSTTPSLRDKHREQKLSLCNALIMEHKAYFPTSSNHIYEAIFDGRDRVVTDLSAPGFGNDIRR
jgi:hypothetical protein